MGNTNSNNSEKLAKKQPKKRPLTNTLNMLQARPNLYNGADNQLSVKFSRNDLIDSVSALSMGTALRPMNGGSRNYTDNELHPNAPKTQTYLKYLSTKTMDMNGGGASTLSSGIVNNLSSQSEGDWNSIKNMLIRGQNGGCGCDAGRVLNGGNNDLSASSSFNLSFTNSQSTMSGELTPQMYGGNVYSATSSMNMSQGLVDALSATSSTNEEVADKTPKQDKSKQDGGNLNSEQNTSSTSMQNINYEMLLGGKKEKKEKKEKKVHKNSSSSSSSKSSTSLSDIDASSSSSTTTTMSGSSPEGVIKRALGRNNVSETTRELKRIEASEQKKEKVLSSSSSSSSSSDSSKSTNSSSSSSTSSNSSSSGGPEAFAKLTRYDNVVLTSEGSANNVINVKQFYSTESGDLFSASSNFLRNNINKNRLR
jgi:hypothetical protein